MIFIRSKTESSSLPSLDADDAAVISRALARGWSLVEVEQVERPIGAAPAKPAPSKPPRAPKPAPVATDAEIQAVVEAMAGTGGEPRPLATIAAGSHLSGRVLARALDAAVSSGRVIREGKARGTRYRLGQG